MQSNFLAGLLIQLFWLSFTPIGLAALLLLDEAYSRNGRKLQILSFFRQAHWLVQGFVCFSAGVGLFILPAVVSYMLKTRIDILKTLYVALMLASILQLYLKRHLIYRNALRRYRALGRLQKIRGGIIIAILVMQAATRFTIGSGILDDVPVHLAKMQHYLNTGHFDLRDPFMGYNGIIDLRYSTNLLNALQVIGASLLRAPAYTVWFYSHAFYVLLIQTALASLFLVYIPRIPKLWLYSAVTVIPFFASLYMVQYAELPHNIALVWGCLFFIGLKLLVDSQDQKGTIVILASSLLAVTHSLAALYTLAYLLLILIIFILFKLSNRTLLPIIISIVILACPVVANQLTPARSTRIAAQRAYGGGLHSRMLETTKLGPLVLPKIELMPKSAYTWDAVIDPTTLGVYAFIAASLLAFRRISNIRHRKLVLILVTLLIILRYNMQYIALSGLIYMLISVKDKLQRVIVATSAIFYALIAYNPIILSVTASILPLWFLARFQELNVFAYLLPIIGLFVVYTWLRKVMRISGHSEGYPVVLIILAVSLLALHQFPVSLNSFMLIGHPSWITHNGDYQSMSKLKNLDASLENSVILTNDIKVRDWYPIATKNKNIGIFYNVQSNQMQNLELRERCYQALLKNLNYDDLRSAKITHIVAGSGVNIELDTQNLSTLANSKHYLQFEQQYDKYRVYAVNQKIKYKQTTNCNMPYKQ